MIPVDLDSGARIQSLELSLFLSFFLPQSARPASSRPDTVDP
jgi:hypothetical protein